MNKHLYFMSKVLLGVAAVMGLRALGFTLEPFSFILGGLAVEAIRKLDNYLGVQS